MFGGIQDMDLLVRQGLAQGGADLDHEVAGDGQALRDTNGQAVPGRG